MSQATRDQGSDFYPGVDNWKPHTIKAGEIICQLDYREQKDINKPKNLPASSYFTDANIKVNKVEGLPSARDFSERVQVKPFRAGPEEKYTYSQNISFYSAKNNIQCEKAIVENNPLYGKGGMVQYFIEDKDRHVKNGNLQFLGVVQTNERSHKIPIFKQAESQNLTPDQLKTLIPKMHEQRIKIMESSAIPEERKAAEKMRSLMRESKDLKEGKTTDKGLVASNVQEKPEAQKRMKR